MDGIRPISGGYKPIHPISHLAPAFAGAENFNAHCFTHALPPKSPIDYLRAIRRQAWLVLTVGLFVSVAGTLLVLRMPAIYRATAEITIEPPRYDHFLSKIINAHSLVQAPSEEAEKYVPDKLAYLRSKALVEKVVRDLSMSSAQPISAIDDPAADLIKNLYSRNQTGTHYYTVWLDGRDPAKVTKALDLLLKHFRDSVRIESTDAIDQSRLYAGQTLEALTRDLHGINEHIYKMTKNSSAIAPGGANVTRERLQAVNQALLMERVKYGDLQRQLRIDATRPSADPRFEARGAQLAKLNDERDMLARRYKNAKKNMRDAGDAYLVAVRAKIGEIDTQIDRLEASQQASADADDFEVILASAREHIQDLEAEQRQAIEDMKEAHPTFDQYHDLVAQRELKQRQIAETQQKLSEFNALARTQKDPVSIVAGPVEPVLPERPKKPLCISIIIIIGLALGMILPCILEHADNTVRVPEHITSGLAVTLLGVVPRIRRTSKIHRGGHLWTPGASDSPAADAYRNIRASLLGVANSHGPIVTLLVTSAKAGEGKSTTALNLAATCARAGERTLLVDVDLRRPSLAGVFPHEDGHLGLVEVLRGELPWQRVVVSTDSPNLDFIPTGDPRNVPIEILGSLEIRQLLLSLSQHHYDRVILDGPAVLGLADCRMLGRIVDASIMVVRYGRQGLPPLRRAKEMLEQSQVRMAGIVFNGITEGVEDWSSYVPGPTSRVGEISNGVMRDEVLVSSFLPRRVTGP